MEKNVLATTMTTKEVLLKYKTVEDVIFDKILYNTERSFILRTLIEYFFTCKSEQKKEKFFNSLIGYTLPLTPADLNYLYEKKIVTIEYHEAGSKVNHNRKYDDWSHEKNDAGFIVSLYEVACLPNEQKKSPMHLGTLNNFVIRIFARDGQIILSIEDGGHRTHCIHTTKKAKRPTVSYKDGVSPKCNEIYNNLFANRDPNNDDENEFIQKTLNEAILPIVFAPEEFDASTRNITKPHNSNDSVAMAFKENMLWLMMKGAVSGENGTSPMFFDKGITNNTIAALFIATKLLGYHKSSKYDGIKFLLNNIHTENECNEVISFVRAYYDLLFSNKEITFLRKVSNYYHTYRNQATIHSMQNVLLLNPNGTEVYRNHKKEYDMLVAKNDSSIYIGTDVKTFAEWFESKYCAYRTIKGIPVHFELARDTIEHIRKSVNKCVKHTHDIDAILEAHNEHQGSGHSGCENKVMTPLVDCLAHNRWAINRPEPKMKYPEKNLAKFAKPNKKKVGVANV